MALNLVELYLNVGGPDSAKQVLDIGKALSADRLPPGVSRVAGPWVSNEESKLILVLDIADHTATLGPFWRGLTSGVIAKRRFTAIADWSTFEKTLSEL